ncbi:hypothetical protein D3871_15945 [Noviherbaspirillum saxi]|uniref:Uncharacterized protein n=1 Tax=Noviherbaspirillum saxi TaxID=2320863 RepID=A0A3A3FHI8_9BURK|nr:hypothetical protein D3871_15945 [Noviherbaspirillum saxi]
MFLDGRVRRLKLQARPALELLEHCFYKTQASTEFGQKHTADIHSIGCRFDRRSRIPDFNSGRPSLVKYRALQHPARNYALRREPLQDPPHTLI